MRRHLALTGDPELLALDEPTAALNDAEVRVLHEIIRRFVRPHTGVIYISHRLDELKGISDRITVLNYGEVLAEGTPTEIQANPRVQEVYLKT